MIQNIGTATSLKLFCSFQLNSYFPEFLIKIFSLNILSLIKFKRVLGNFLNLFVYNSNSRNFDYS